MRRLAAAVLAAFAIAAAACNKGGADDPGTELLIVVNAPFSVSGLIGRQLFQGVKLAVDEINAEGGIETASGTFTLRVEKMDNALSPQRGLANVRRAIDEGAVAIVDEGTGVNASWRLARQAGVPICIVFQGGQGLIDPEDRPNVFRIAPTDHGVAFRLAEYLVPKGLKVALLHDDSEYGQQGELALNDSFGHVPDAVPVNLTVPAGEDPTTQVLQARRSGATALLVWGEATTIAQVVRAARSSGWDVPIYTPPSGEDPLVRQQLSDHPEWVDGLTFASGRMTAEKGPGPFLSFQDAYEKAFGPDDTGVTTADGKRVTQPPDYAMYPYDFVHVLAAAIKAAGGTDGRKILAALEQVEVQGANGDERGFNEVSHEGVVDDDVYFAVFHDMTYAPVKDDPLSSTLQVIPQT